MISSVSTLKTHHRPKAGMPVLLAVPRLRPSEMCPLSFIGDALSVADSGRTRDVMVDTFSNIVVELFFWQDQLQSPPYLLK